MIYVYMFMFEMFKDIMYIYQANQIVIVWGN